MRITEKLTGERKDIFHHICLFRQEKVSPVSRTTMLFLMKINQLEVSHHRKISPVSCLPLFYFLKFKMKVFSSPDRRTHSPASPVCNIEKYFYNIDLSLNTQERKFQSKQRKLEEPLKVYNLLSLHKQNNRINTQYRMPGFTNSKPSYRDGKDVLPFYYIPWTNTFKELQ